MAIPRSQQIDFNITTDYHLVSRCVRKVFLCGIDKDTGKNYEHRRQWIEDRIIHLSRSFSIGLCAFAVMSNHSHVVIRVNKEQALKWEAHEVITRWNAVCPGNKLCQAFLAGNKLSDAQKEELPKSVEKWRERLYNVSWFMAKLNEHIARKANKEDGCTGSFWDGRFKSKGILDDRTLLTCMVYVDLNPIRAGIAKTPEASPHTSAKKRIDCARKSKNTRQPVDLLPFLESEWRGPEGNIPFAINYSLDDYLMLLDWTGKRLRKDKQGAIDSELPPILERLGITERQWEDATQKFGTGFKYLAGAPVILEATYRMKGYLRIPGMSASKSFFTD